MAGYHWALLAAVPLTAAALLLALVGLRPQELCEQPEGAVAVHVL
jgi:hypothetical protein